MPEPDYRYLRLRIVGGLLVYALLGIARLALRWYVLLPAAVGTAIGLMITKQWGWWGG